MQSSLVIDDVVVGEGYNQPISQHDPSAHAELNCSAARGGTTSAKLSSCYSAYLWHASLYRHDRALHDVCRCALAILTLILGALQPHQTTGLFGVAHEPKAGAIDTHEPGPSGRKLAESFEKNHLDVTSGHHPRGDA